MTQEIMYDIYVKFIPVSKVASIEQALQFMHNTSGIQCWWKKLPFNNISSM